MAYCDLRWAKYQLALGFAVRRRAWTRGFSIRLHHYGLQSKSFLDRLLMADDLFDKMLEQYEIGMEDLEATDWGFF